MVTSPKKARNAPTNVGKAAECEVVELSARSVRAIAEAIAEKLLDIGPKLARLAAADTIHTIENPNTVLKRAIDEGVSARTLLLSPGAGEVLA